MTESNNWTTIVRQSSSTLETVTVVAVGGLAGLGGAYCFQEILSVSGHSWKNLVRCQSICLFSLSTCCFAVLAILQYSLSCSTCCHLPPAEISKYLDEIVQLRSASLVREGECVQLTILLFLQSEITRELKNQANLLSSVTLDSFPTWRDDRVYGMDDDFSFSCRQAVEGKVDGEEERLQPTVTTVVDVSGKKRCFFNFVCLVSLTKSLQMTFVSVNFLVSPLLLCQSNLVNLSRKEELRDMTLHIVNKIHMRCVWYEIVSLSRSSREETMRRTWSFLHFSSPFPVS